MWRCSGGSHDGTFALGRRQSHVQHRKNQRHIMNIPAPFARRHHAPSSSTLATVLALCVWYHHPPVAVAGWKFGGLSSNVNRASGCHRVGSLYNRQVLHPAFLERISFLSPHRQQQQQRFSSHLSSSRTTSFVEEDSFSELGPSVGGEQRDEQKDRDDLLVRSTKGLPRLYIDSGEDRKSGMGVIALTRQAIVPLTHDQAHYLQVMRITNPKRWGDYAGHVRIFDGVSGEWLAKLAVLEAGTSTISQKKRRSNRKDDASDDSGAVLECLEPLRQQPSPHATSLWLYTGRLKKPRRKWVLEKVTELGVDGISVVDTEFSSTNGDPWEYEKHRVQVVEATEQCERLTVPSLTKLPMVWDELVSAMQQHANSTRDYWLVCRERSESSAPILMALQDIHHGQYEQLAIGHEQLAIGQPDNNDSYVDEKRPMIIHVLVGPEGGWSAKELDVFSSLIAAQSETQTKRVQFVSLGCTVLRAETAAITSVATIKMFQEARGQNMSITES